MKTTEYIAFLVLALMSASCAFLHDDLVVARLGRKKLYRSQIEKIVPPGTSPEDSAAIAARFIDAWARDLIMNEMASTKLSKKDKNVRKELENYRKSLLRYRFEQQYISERLDTAVSSQEIQEYYYSHPDQFRTSAPLVKVRFVKFAQNNPLKPQIVELLMSKDTADVQALDSLCHTMMASYTSFGDKWVDVATLAKEFDMNVNSMTEKVSNKYADAVNDKGENCVAYVTELVKAGVTAPLEYCTGKIRETIISLRKYAISSSLEQDLLQQAAREGKYEIIPIDETKRL